MTEGYRLLHPGVHGRRFRHHCAPYKDPYDYEAQHCEQPESKEESETAGEKLCHAYRSAAEGAMRAFQLSVGTD
jgi:hypothetical protein